ncbi:RDD family protein [Sinomonas sp. JGH33]|uniref:RDD family protein n=1 Tax=Sinomonas terricola TaxID=3110330 RepID=A0ABU5T1S7_9MICC|nr:RDD family protein [Sinomonas sp. JGH33]MEA5453600.1 RDD family protein [Sinomonas sp. JGH33]
MTAAEARLVDGQTGKPIRTVASTGELFAVAPAGRVFWARVLDAVVVLVVAGVLISVVASALARTAASGSAIFGVCAVAWFAVVFGYGVIAGTAGSLGDRAAGIRAIRLDDGTGPGPWRGGWRAVLWSFAPLFVVFTVTAVFSGGPVDVWTARYAARDLRAGIERGTAPVPDPRVALREARERERERRRQA